MTTVNGISLTLVAIVVALLFSPSTATGSDDHHHANDPLSLGREKVTNIHFFLHDIISGPKPTAVKVAAANVTLGIQSVTPFGSVYVIDDPLTSGPELRDDAVVGRAQGLYASTGQLELSLFMGVDFTFTKDEHAGGSFTVASRNPISSPNNRELAVVGGRGKFRMARGFALLKTNKLDFKTGDAVIEYNVTLLHY